MTGDLDTAQRVMDAALEWARANPGPEHSDLIRALLQDGRIAILSRKFDGAETLFGEALENADATPSPDPVLLYQLLRSLLAVRWHSGHDAVNIAKRLSRLSASQLQRDIAGFLGGLDRLPFGQADFSQRLAQEPHDLAFRALRGDLDRVIATLIDAPAARTELAEAVVMRKAAVQDAMAGFYVSLSKQENHPPVVADALASYFRTMPSDPPGATLAPLDRLRANAAAMNLLAYADPHITPDRLPRPLQLQHERTELERQIAHTIQADGNVASLDAIRQAMPEDALVLEYAVYSRPPTAHDARGESRYLLVAISSRGVEGAADIGPAAEIDALIAAACRAILRDAEEGSHCSGQNPPESTDYGTIKAVGQKLYAVLLGPVAQAMANAAHIIVSPDGALNFFPFEILTDRSGNYLIGTHLVSYVQSAREIPMWKTATASHGPPVILADPDYDAGGTAPSGECSDSPRGPRRKLRAAEDLLGFPRLCGAADEARLVLKALPEAKVLTRGEATEEAVKGLFGPRILHVATHGFAAGKLDWPRTWFHPQFQMWWNQQDYEVMENDPMLRGGLVFAGANSRRSPGGHGAGMLSAREASLLNLTGTQLVVLSACDSGLGLARAGDGVAGLRRAFALGGARAQTFSLWPVGDWTTAEFMRRYYTLLAEGRPNVEALAEVKREFLGKGGILAEPWIWAVFVGYGYPGTLGR